MVAGAALVDFNVLKKEATNMLYSHKNCIYYTCTSRVIQKNLQVLNNSTLTQYFFNQLWDMYLITCIL